MRGLCAIVLLLASLALLAGCGDDPQAFEKRLDDSIARSRAWLVSRQSPDGAWRSETYGALKDGLSLTPPVLKALVFGPRDAQSDAAVERGLDWLAACARADGTIDPGPTGIGFPVYTASLAVLALTRGGRPADVRARDAWLRLLAGYQLSPALGWTSDDPAFGGWGYSLVPPAKGALSADNAWDADLSSTLCALGALRVAGVPATDERVQRALRFVARCQNLPLEASVGSPALGDATRDDGGFFFTPTNDIQNKAGVRFVEPSGRVRYNSYGSMTADGLRALLRCGLAHDHPRVRAARRWLEQHFDATSNPGKFEDARADERDASYYYWSWSVAHALSKLGVETLETPRGRVDWRAELGAALLSRQAPDGTWRNRSTMVKEDDPLIATSLATAAVVMCRLRLPFPAR